VQLIPENSTPEEPDGRQDVHNSDVDTQMAAAHLCGKTDLRTGRTCTKRARHEGACEFVPKDAAQEVVRDLTPGSRERS
jgi:hypothetical protein